MTYFNQTNNTINCFTNIRNSNQNNADVSGNYPAENTLLDNYPVSYIYNKEQVKDILHNNKIIKKETFDIDFDLIFQIRNVYKNSEIESLYEELSRLLKKVTDVYATNIELLISSSDRRKIEVIKSVTSESYYIKTILREQIKELNKNILKFNEFNESRKDKNVKNVWREKINDILSDDIISILNSKKRELERKIREAKKEINTLGYKLCPYHENGKL